MARNNSSSAIAHVSGGEDYPELRGVVRFLPRCGGTLVVADISREALKYQRFLQKYEP